MCTRVLCHQRPHYRIMGSGPLGALGVPGIFIQPRAHVDCPLALPLPRWVLQSLACGGHAVTAGHPGSQPPPTHPLPFPLAPPPQTSAPWSTASPQDSCSGAGWPSPCSCLASWSRASATCGSERTGSQARAGQPRCASCSSACGSGKLVTRGRGRALPARVPPPGTAKLAAPSQHLAPWSRKWAQLPAQAGLRSPAGDVRTEL